MPHKNNPVYSERIIVLVKHIHALNNVVLNSMMCENERDPRSLWAEWLVYPQLFVYFDAALEYLIKILQNISINEKRMFKNLKNIGDTIVSEYLVFRLGKILGQKQAKKIIDEAMKKALHCNKSLKDILLGTDLGEKISLEDIYILNHPETYIGNSIGIVEKTLKEDI
jgi:adenylosuccinate lyase